ncbi:SSU ribosomal protein S28E [Methanocella conradii HZ254]|uniref:Small ribosomal subunit protein eS28 n=1 Tax=Methanocella conradii (strain DSM 24694 / JCM 17849 / CGMCC 1.5162 / HZ254) TaxID=1041930 RepID=H8I4Q6_METCZ|nr:30S ribosomal protein S28e [Methanocella conradii]AFD00651.1 SSU ribosomal protein S28E [Methanocella conradii HZ254]MDI6896349.1 30S ribosomal protein S28e [Methanocella conradii]
MIRLVEETGVPAEVIEIIGVTGMHGEAVQIKCKILEGTNKGRIITRNTIGPVRLGDVLILMETAREAKKLSGR